MPSRITLPAALVDALVERQASIPITDDDVISGILFLLEEYDDLRAESETMTRTHEDETHQLKYKIEQLESENTRLSDRNTDADEALDDERQKMIQLKQEILKVFEEYAT